MTWLIIGLIVFFGIHLLPSCTRLRGRLIEGVGELPYKGAFSVIALAGLALIVTGMGRAPYVALWQPPAMATTVVAIVMAPALILLAAANFNNNIKRIVRHPMSLGLLLWSLSHLLANGDLAALLTFGGFAAFALYNLRAGKQPAPAQAEARKPVSIKKDLLAAFIGLVAYFLLVAFHRPLFGVAIFL